MASQTNEQALEASIEKFLTGTSLEEQRSVQEAVPFSQHHGYRLGQASDFNARYAVDTRFLWQFLEATQIEELARLKERYDNWQTRILDRFDKLAKKYGTLHLLKRGLDIDDVHFHLMYPAPLASSSAKVKQNFQQNIFSVHGHSTT